MSVPKAVKGYDVIPIDDAKFVVLKPQQPYNQVEKVFIICWPYDLDEDNRYMATSFTSRSDTAQLRKLRDAIQELLDHQADTVATEIKEIEQPDKVDA